VERRSGAQGIRFPGSGVFARMIRHTHLAIVGAVLLAAPARAQGLSIVPSFAISRIFDDNVFYRPSGESDFTTRFSPRIDVVYDSERFAWSGRYLLDADRFERHPQLTTAHARQDLGVDATYHVSRGLSVGGNGTFVESQTPIDLNLEVAPAPGRVRARRFQGQASTTYQAGPRTDATVRYITGGDSLADGVSVLTQGTTATIAHHVSPRTDLRFEYSHQHYRFERVDASASQALTAEWSRTIDRSTGLSLRFGPRVTDGVWSPEVSAAVHRQLRTGEAVVTYLHTTTTLLGLAALADMHSLTALVGAQPRPGVKVQAGPAFLHTTQGALTSAVYRLSGRCEWPVGRRLLITGAYDVNVQRGNIYTAESVETIGHNRLLVTLAVASARTVAR
jgi:hypothetical protein